MKIFIIIVVLLVIWSAWGYFSSNVEQAEFTVIEKNDTYEIRNYSAHIEAQTIVQGNFDDSINNGFSIIAGYIFGGNTKKESVAMTTPVTVNIDDGLRIVSFVMPKKYNLETLPEPTDSRVKLVATPAKKVAVLSFSWFRNVERINKMEQKLIDSLIKDNIEMIGKPSYAGYNAPWTPPWMNHNEVLMEIK
jgi:hypothetical protein